MLAGLIASLRGLASRVRSRTNLAKQLERGVCAQNREQARALPNSRIQPAGEILSRLFSVESNPSMCAWVCLLCAKSEPTAWEPLGKGRDPIRETGFEAGKGLLRKGQVTSLCRWEWEELCLREGAGNVPALLCPSSLQWDLVLPTPWEFMEEIFSL